jgi:hypothetical protein
MKRIIIVLALAATFASTAVAQRVTSYPIGNEHVLKFTNLLKDQYQPFFDYAALAKEFERISNDYGLSTDIDIGLNPTDKGIWLTVQGLKIDPKQPSKYRPVIEGEAAYLPLQLQADAATAAYLWFMSFLANPVVPQEIQMLLSRTSVKSTRFLVAVEEGLRTLSVSGSLTGGRIVFDPQYKWQDFYNAKALVMKTIQLPQRSDVSAALRNDLRLYLASPVDPAKPGFEGETMGVYRFFMLR